MNGHIARSVVRAVQVGVTDDGIVDNDIVAATANRLWQRVLSISIRHGGRQIHSGWIRTELREAHKTPGIALAV